MADRWWWCVEHAQVEGDDGCRNAVRLGPYESAELAADAIELAHRRTEEWDRADAWPDSSPDVDED